MCRDGLYPTSPLRGTSRCGRRDPVLGLSPQATHPRPSGAKTRDRRFGPDARMGPCAPGPAQKTPRFCTSCSGLSGRRSAHRMRYHLVALRVQDVLRACRGLAAGDGRQSRPGGLLVLVDEPGLAGGSKLGIRCPLIARPGPPAAGSPGLRQGGAEQDVELDEQNTQRRHDICHELGGAMAPVTESVTETRVVVTSSGRRLDMR